jgi:hypothetical protein
VAHGPLEPGHDGNVPKRRPATTANRPAEEPFVTVRGALAEGTTLTHEIAADPVAPRLDPSSHAR